MSASTAERFLAALDGLRDTVVAVLPQLLAALLVVVVGCLVAWVVRWAARRLLTLARFDRLADSLGVSGGLARADVTARPSALAASALFWLVLLAFLLAALRMFEVEAVNQLTTDFILYLPRLFTAMLILLFGFLVANFLARAALIAAVNAGLPSARMFSLVIKVLITILAFAMALEQLRIARSIVLAAFVISFGSVSLGLALAFGLGGRDAARRVLEGRHTADGERDDGDGVSHL